MYLTYIGHNQIHDLDFNINRPFGSGDYLALLIKSHGIFTLKNKTIIIKPNTFFLYKEGTPQCYKAYNERFSNDWFQFKLEKGDKEFFKKLHIPFETPITLNNICPLSLIIKTIAGEKYSNSPFSQEIIENYLHIFFMKIARTLNHKDAPLEIPHYEEMALLRSKIYNRPYEKWSINALAHEITLSPSHFQRLYKKLFGVTCIKMS